MYDVSVGFPTVKAFSSLLSWHFTRGRIRLHCLMPISWDHFFLGLGLKTGITLGTVGVFQRPLHHAHENGTGFKDYSNKCTAGVVNAIVGTDGAPETTSLAWLTQHIRIVQPIPTAIWLGS